MISKRLLILPFAVANLHAAAALGSVTGTVADSNGKPLPGTVRVFLSQALPSDGVRHPAPPVQTGPHVTSRLADKNGSFNIGTLAPGSYIACASTSQPGYLTHASGQPPLRLSPLPPAKRPPTSKSR